MTKDEALKMAIEFIDNVHEGEWLYVGFDREDVINACKEALKPHPDCDEACMFQCEMENKHNQWQGLTDDEIDDIIKNVFNKSTIELNGVKTCSVRDGVRAIEQSLKDKNDH